MNVHVIPAWEVRNKTYVGFVYTREESETLAEQGYRVVYEPQHKICVKQRPRPKLDCYMCQRGYSSYYVARN